ncbi:MAG: HNH endonuclease signature motif containing protein [Bacteroidota bacterium]
MNITEKDKIRFNSKYKINPDSGCWEWTGGLKSSSDPLNQYGKFSIGLESNNSKRMVYAHRASYTIFKGEITNGLWVLHNCDNPKCVNPDHLFLGTRQDNVDDRERKGRNRILYGEQRYNTKLTNHTVANIKFDINKGLTKKEILKKHNLSPVIYKDIKAGKTWKQILPSPPQNQAVEGQL